MMATEKQMQNVGKKGTIAFGFCGSFCSYEAVVPMVAQLQNEGYQVRPLMSFHAAHTDTRFGTAEHWKKTLEEMTGYAVIESLTGAEPIGPKNMADAMVIAPCTGTTLAKLALGISNTPVTLAAKSLLRGGKPIVIAVSTNDGLGASSMHIATLLQRKNIYFVPFAQDDFAMKPQSLKADFTKISKTLADAFEKKQIQPILQG